MTTDLNRAYERAHVLKEEEEEEGPSLLPPAQKVCEPGVRSLPSSSISWMAEGINAIWSK